MDTNTEYEATVVERHPSKPDMKQTTTGGAKTTAAWLRALANEIDPTPAVQPQKPTCRCAPPVQGSGSVGTKAGTFITRNGRGDTPTSALHR